MDLISGLPDDLIFEFLNRLRCARATVRTSALSRRWRRLCNRLPELRFRNIDPDHLDAALASVATAGRVLSLLEIDVSHHHHHPLAPPRISSLLQAAARLAPAVLIVSTFGFECEWSAMADAVELPCFRRATSLNLEVPGVNFTLPPAGDFPALDSISFVSCHVDLADLLPRCPRLRKLRISSLKLLMVTVHSPSLEELDVVTDGLLRRVDISAPSLKKLRLEALGGLDNEVSLSFSAPLLEELWWMCCCSSSPDVWLGQIWRLSMLNLMIQPKLDQLAGGCESREPPRSLWLYIEPSDILTGELQSIERELSQFLVTSFTHLELRIRKEGHVYGPLVLRLLGANAFIQGLKVKLCGVREETCSVNCPCDHSNWRSHRISLTNLKEMEIQGFGGESHELDLLKVILKSATMLQTMSLYLPKKVSPISNGCLEEVCQLSKSYPSVLLNIYRCPDEHVYMYQ